MQSGEHSLSRRLSKRHGDILRIVEAEGTVTIGDLAVRLQVSPETVRRDLRPLVDGGALMRMHGAVAAPTEAAEAPFRRRMLENAVAKRAVAEAVATRIADGTVLMMDTGTTTSFLARALSARRNLTVITNSTDAARTLGGRGNRVFLAGGEMRPDSGACLGSTAVAFIRGFSAAVGVISAGAVWPSGVMDYDPAEADLANALLDRCEHTILATDHSKFGRPGLVQVCGFARLDLVVTERAPPKDIAAAMTKAGAEISVVPAVRASV